MFSTSKQRSARCSSPGCATAYIHALPQHDLHFMPGLIGTGGHDTRKGRFSCCTAVPRVTLKKHKLGASEKSGWIRQFYVRPKVLYIPDPQGIYSSQLRSQLQHLGIHLERVELLTCCTGFKVAPKTERAGRYRPARAAGWSRGQGGVVSASGR